MNSSHHDPRGASPLGEGLPDPPVPAECDLRSFPYMPLDVLRLRDSDAAAMQDAEAFRAAVLSWCASWHQIPAASLPDDDAALCRLLGYGRDIAEWRRVRAAGALRGWSLHSDGRLYHRVVADKALSAWQSKIARQKQTAKATEKRWARRGRDVVTSSVTDSVTDSVMFTNREEKRREEKSPIPSESDVPPRQVPMPLVLTGGGSERAKGRKADYSAEFEAWWCEYPKKVAKDAAVVAFTRAIARGATPADLLTGLRRAVWDPNPRFIPHASRWLNEGRWRDEVTPTNVIDPTGNPHVQPDPNRAVGPDADAAIRRAAIVEALAGGVEPGRRAAGGGAAGS